MAWEPASMRGVSPHLHAAGSLMPATILSQQGACGIAAHTIVAKGGGAVATIEIRECTHDEIDAVLTLDREWEQEAIAHVFVPISREDFVASLTQFPSTFFVAEYAGRIIGYINGTVQIGTDATIIPAHEPYLVIENLYVTREFRHQHVGGQLLERCMAAGEQQGLHRFVVGSNSKQIDKILTFYQDHGFKLYHVQLVK
jgi:ribosomal protein S18 acetylase RimI-like enzyme